MKWTNVHKCKWVWLCNTIFLHGNSLRWAVWSRKIHVQIMRFTCCLNMAFTWKSLNWALICMYDVTLECVAAVTDHFADAFVREKVARVYMTLWRRNDVRKLTLTPFCLRNKVLENGYVMFKRRFQRYLCWNQVKYARTMITHRERSGSVVECLTRDRRAAGLSLTGVTALWSLSKTHLS